MTYVIKDCTKCGGVTRDRRRISPGESVVHEKHICSFCKDEEKIASFNLDIGIGDILLGGRFKNKRIKVNSLGRDELGQPTFNKGKKLLAVRIEKKLPQDKKSSKTKEMQMDKEANISLPQLKAFGEELQKISGYGDMKVDNAGEKGFYGGAAYGLAYGAGKGKKLLRSTAAGGLLGAATGVGLATMANKLRKKDKK